MAYIKTVQELIDILSSLTEEQKQMMVRIEDTCGDQYIEYVEEHGDSKYPVISIQSENANFYYGAKCLWPHSDWEVEG